MSDLLLEYRSFVPDLEIRSGGLEDGRTVFGIAVPWDVPQMIDTQLTEQWAQGAFNHQLNAPKRIRFAREHVDRGGVMIGAAQLMRNDPKGLYVELRASRTVLGDDTLELIKDGALHHLSIGFRARQSRRLPDGSIQRVTADLFEIAATMEGAFGDLAAVGGVRDQSGATVHGHPVMAEFCRECTHCTTPAGLEQVRSILADLQALPEVLSA